MSDPTPENSPGDDETSAARDASAARGLSWDEFLGGVVARDDAPAPLRPPTDGSPLSPHHDSAHGTHEAAPRSRRAARASAQAQAVQAQAARAQAAQAQEVGPTPPSGASYQPEPQLQPEPPRTPERAPHTARSQRRAQLAGLPPREKKRRKGAWGCLIVLVVVLALLAGGAFAFQGPIGALISKTQGPADFQGSGTGVVTVMIHEGENGEDIANTLAKQKVVASFDAFYSLLLKQSPAPIFQPGVYKLANKMSAKSALSALMSPENKLDQTVIVPEGTAEADILQLVSEGTSIPLADLKAAAGEVSSYGLPPEATKLEGFLFPATYTFDPSMSAHDVLKTMVDRQFQALDAAGVAPTDRWKTIVLASLIQREAGLKDDYYKVSRVFLNRLDPKQWSSGLLQSDATVAYGTGNTHRVSTTDAERADAGNPYNTYVHPGLPIGPISNPGDLAIDAALHPAEGTWLYFVTWNLDTGETIFSTTMEEHDAAVAKWLAWMHDHPEYG